jgi:hypothetical protein
VSFLIAAPQLIADAATDLANIGSTIGSANFAAATATTGVLPAAADEVSAAIAALFSQHAAGYQQLSAQAALFHEQFVQAMTSGASAYAATEANVVQTLAPALAVDLSGGLSGLGASLSAGVSEMGASFNAMLSGSLGGSFSGFAPVGAALAADVGGGLSALGQAGGALSSGFGAGLSGLAGGFSAGLPGFGGSLTGGLSGLSAVLTGGFSGSFSGGLSGLGAGLSGFLQTGASLVGNLGGSLPGLGVSLPVSLNAGLAAFGSLFEVTPSFGVNVATGLSGLGAQLSAALNGGLAVGLSGLPTLFANAVTPFQALVTAGSQTGFFNQLQAMELGFNTALVDGEFGFNNSLVAQETALETAIFGGTGAWNGVLDNVFNFWNSVLGTGEVTFDTLLGAQIPSYVAPISWYDLATSLYVGPMSNVIGGGWINGLTGAFDQKFLFDLNVAGAATGGVTGNGALQTSYGTTANALGFQGGLFGELLDGSWVTALPPWAQTVLAVPPVDALQSWVAPQVYGIEGLAHNEAGFNANLLNSEMTWETATFGTNDAFNGALNRGFNVGNLFVVTGEQTVNSLLGSMQAPTVAPFYAGGQCEVFNGGNIGGIEGIFDQTLVAGADLIDLM